MYRSRFVTQRPTAVVSVALANYIRRCATTPPAAGEKPAAASAANAAEGNGTAGSANAEGATASSSSEIATHNPSEVVKSSSSFLQPSDDIVLEYARKALMRDGRDKVPESIIWAEDTTYPPILARGKRNHYDYTDDIPKHVKPMWGHEWYQQREYFQSMRNRKPWPQRIAGWMMWGSFIGFLVGIVLLLRIWVQQPRDLVVMRGEMLQMAYGRVLEMAAGHGQNIGLYPYAVHEIVLCDSSAAQLQTLRYRIPQAAYPKYEVRKLQSERLEEFKDAEFDCVVDMFGLCHYRDPVMTLRQMQRVVKPTGMLLLLEHGSTPYPWVNWFLNYFERRHTVNTHGCKWNQPVMDYLKESNLEVKELRNMHFGTTYYIVAYPENIDSLKQQVEAQLKA